MYKPESVLENKSYKILWDSEIQMGHLILARKTDLVLINKKRNLLSNGFYHSSGPQRENKKAKR